jgi:hypothetical protein
MLSPLIDVLNPNFVVRSVNDAIRQNKVHIVRGMLVAGPAPSEPKTEASVATKGMVDRLLNEGKLTDWYPGTLAPGRSGIYIIDGYWGNSMFSYERREWEPGVFAYYDCIKELWYKQALTPQEAEKKWKAGYKAMDATPQSRAFEMYKWRGFKYKQE